ncbi:MAG: response regulator [Pseudomonadota bacterium]
MAIILIIEDEAGIRNNLMRFFRLEGHTPVAAVDGLDGLEVARNQLPAIIFCDVLMPRLGGFEVLAALKQDPLLQNTPFYFVSASAETEHLQTGIELGACGYLTKPFHLPELQALLRKHLA